MRKQVFVTLIAVSALALMLTQVLAAQEPQRPAIAPANSTLSMVTNIHGLELVSQIGGEVNAVAVQGNYAYYGLGPRLVVLNITDPNHAFVVGRTEVLSSTVADVVTAGDYAYVAGDAGLFIINIADPTHPALTGIAASPFGTGYNAVSVVGQTAYLAAAGGTESGLYLVDVTNPAAPHDVGHYFTSDVGNSVMVVGQYAYLADESGLRIINVSTPGTPSLAGSYPMADTRSVAVSGSYAYVGDVSGLFSILNVSNPASISSVGAINPGGGTIGDVQLVDNTAYLAAGSRLSIVDVTNRSAPTALGYINSRNYQFIPAVAVAGSYAYLAESGGGLGIINVSTPATPTEAGFQASVGDAFDVAVAGSYAYLTNWNDGLHIIDVSNVAAPGQIGAYSTWPNGAKGVTVMGNTAYLGEAGGFRLVNVANRSQPTSIGFLSTPANVSHVAVAGSTAYLANQDRGLRIINISNPASPSEVGFWDTPGYASDVVISGTYAYVADGDQGLRIINIANSASPSEVGSYVPAGYAYAQGIAVAGHYAYLVGGGNGLYIVDVSNPATPTGIVHATRQSASGVAVAGNYAYVADSTGLLIVNVADPAHPIDVAYTPLPGAIVRVAVAGNYVFVATQDSGLITLWFVPPVSASIPVAGGSLMSSSDNTSYTFPAGTFASTVMVTHTQRFPGNVPLPPAHQFGIGHSFEVTATTAGGLPTQIVAGHTYTLTVAYADAEKGPALENTLALYYWNGSQWIQEPSSTVNIGANTVTAHPDHFSVWAVFGQTHQLYLPLIKKN